MKNIFKTLVFVSTGLSLALMIESCSSSNNSSSSGNSNATLTYLYQNVFSKGCVQCHMPGGAATVSNGTQVDFSSASQSYITLVGKTVMGATTGGHCNQVNLVAASNPNTSYIVGILIQSYYGNNFGGQTGCTPYANHLTDQSLTSDEQAALVAWIQAGAPNN